MIFLGDIAHPFTSPPDFSVLQAVAEAQPTVINLEGALDSRTEWLRETRLFNHISVLDALKAIDTHVAVLANNHICDLPDGIALTRQRLSACGIQCVGAGQNSIDAAEPARLVVNGHEVIIIAFGWSTIGCHVVSAQSAGVQPLETRIVLSAVHALRNANPRAKIIPIFHWNYELEPHPQPAHRRLAFAAIEAGADAVVAHHPHCVGGFEFHKGKLIAHSIGNWWMPQGVFFNGKLRFPDYTLPQVALEWHPDKSAVLHWFRYERSDHAIVFERSETIDPDRHADMQTPYVGFQEQEYLNWFRKNRRKRKALPIYTDPHSAFVNSVFDRYVRLRHPAIMMLKKVKREL